MLGTWCFSIFKWSFGFFPGLSKIHQAPASHEYHWNSSETCLKSPDGVLIKFWEKFKVTVLYDLTPTYEHNLLALSQIRKKYLTFVPLWNSVLPWNLSQSSLISIWPLFSLISSFECKLLNLKVKSSHHFTCTAICTLLVYHNIIVVSPLWLKFKIRRKKVRTFEKGSTLEKNSKRNKLF